MIRLLRVRGIPRTFSTASVIFSRHDTPLPRPGLLGSGKIRPPGGVSHHSNEIAGGEIGRGGRGKLICGGEDHPGTMPHVG